jgi:tetratricopeptide (TPR) repeat protein
MSVKVASNRFIVSSTLKSAAFYQHLIQANSSLQELGQLLTREAEQAQEFRHTKRLEELGALLTCFPLKEFQLIGQYYLGWCEYRKGESPRRAFEAAIEQSSTYKVKGLISLGAIVTGGGDIDSGLSYYREAVRYARTPSALVSAAKSIAVIKAINGDHKQALKELEGLLPIAKYTTPKVYFDYLNSLAVETSEVGRTAEAQNISKIVLASPLTFAYPEWRETEQDLALRGYKSRSSIRVKQIPGNIAYLPEREASDTPVIQEERARVFSLKEWKEEKMVKEPNGNEFDNMTEKDLVIKIFQMAAEEGMTWKKLRKIIDYIDKVYSEPDE